MTAPTLHLRSELGKANERRSALTPTTAKALLDAGFEINIERSVSRIFDDAEFENVGATLVPEGSWPDAPLSHIIIGLKELPVQDFPLRHVHIQFAHCYKEQSDWESVLARFPRGGGTLLDLEFLTDESGRRVAAFGFHAGFAGAAIAVQSWAWQLTHPDTTPMPGVSAYHYENDLITDVKSAVKTGIDKSGAPPRVLVIGALGRCGRGAVDLCLKAGIPTSSIIKWDMAETAAGGPFDEILESDIFINCIYLSSRIPHFVDRQSLQKDNRRLRVICDVSADSTNPNNPLPVYDITTTFEKPTVPVATEKEPSVSVISIDHLPSLLPREASEAFSADLLPSLLQLRGDWREAQVWKKAEALFREKVTTLPKELL